MNQVTLMGYIAAKPDLKFLSSGKPVASLRMATNESYKDATGKLVNKATWHQVTVYGKSAESCAQYLDKGRQILVSGKISNRSYVAKDGTTRYVSEVVASCVQFVGAKPTATQTTQNVVSEEVVEKEAALPPQEEVHQQLRIEDVVF